MAFELFVFLSSCDDAHLVDALKVGALVYESVPLPFRAAHVSERLLLCMQRRPVIQSMIQVSKLTSKRLHASLAYSGRQYQQGWSF
jgi:hypothetical protein